MKGKLVLGTTLTVCATTAGAFGGEGDFANTMNFANVTATNIDQNVAEQANNEKEVDFGDFDNDGDLDVVIGNAQSDFGQRRNKLYRNDDGVMFEVSGAPVISGFSQTDVTRNAFFRDYNLDGWLDIIVVNDSNTGGQGGATKLYLNQGNGQFANYTTSGIIGGAACGAVSLDFDGDGDDDLYVGNYPNNSQDSMSRNNHIGTGSSIWTTVTGSMVPSDGDYTVDVASADMNGDGKMDLLISNWGNSYCYYNDLQEAGSQLGDYRYGGGGTQGRDTLGNAGANENSMEPGDFDNDGDMDFYWSNYSGSTGDRIFVNTGNGSDGKANFTQNSTAIPLFPKINTSRKATVADLNDDGRVDIFVMAENTRPSILRNTSVNGQMSFVDWTPFPAVSGTTQRGWHAAAFDADGDEDLDIFIGGWTNDHMLHNVDSFQVFEDAEGAGELNPLVNGATAVLGSGGTGDVDEYTLNLASGNDVSIVLNGPDDYILELKNEDGTTEATSNRGTNGTEEAFQVDNVDGGAMSIVVTIVDGASSPTDLNGDGTTDTIDLLALLGDWGKCKGCSGDLNGDNLIDTIDLLQLLGGWGPNPVNNYVLEVLARP